MTLPPVPEPFYWTNAPWGPVIRCAALDPVAQHCFTTRQLVLTDAAAGGRAGPAVGLAEAQVVSARQVHGRDVVVLAPERPPRLRGPIVSRNALEADAFVSNDPDRAVLIRVADCVPLLMADRRTGAVAAVHAGWRGTAAGIVAATVDALNDEWRCEPKDLIAVMGPAIGPCCYEVGPDVVDQFAGNGHPRHLIDRWFLARPHAHGETARPRLRLDVPGANRDQLLLAGVPEDQIHVLELCTAMHLNVLTSYRAEGVTSGRLAGIIRARAPGQSVGRHAGRVED